MSRKARAAVQIGAGPPTLTAMKPTEWHNMEHNSLSGLTGAPTRTMLGAHPTMQLWRLTCSTNRSARPGARQAPDAGRAESGHGGRAARGGAACGALHFGRPRAGSRTRLHNCGLSWRHGGLLRRGGSSAGAARGRLGAHLGHSPREGDLPACARRRDNRVRRRRGWRACVQGAGAAHPRIGRDSPPYYDANITFRRPGNWILRVQLEHDTIGPASQDTPLRIGRQPLLPAWRAR